MGWYASPNDPNVLLAYLNKGWTDDSLGYEYISQHFIKFAHKPASADHKRLIILDSYSSYINWNFCMFCLEHNIILLCLPAHSTHLLQPLDLQCSALWSTVMDRLLMTFVTTRAKEFTKVLFGLY